MNSKFFNFFCIWTKLFTNNIWITFRLQRKKQKQQQQQQQPESLTNWILKGTKKRQKSERSLTFFVWFTVKHSTKFKTILVFFFSLHFSYFLSSLSFAFAPVLSLKLPRFKWTLLRIKMVPINTLMPYRKGLIECEPTIKILDTHLWHELKKETLEKNPTYCLPYCLIEKAFPTFEHTIFPGRRPFLLGWVQPTKKN